MKPDKSTYHQKINHQTSCGKFPCWLLFSKWVAQPPTRKTWIIIFSSYNGLGLFPSPKRDPIWPLKNLDLKDACWTQPSFKNGCMEMMFSNHFLYKDLVNHPIDSQFTNWLALGLQDDDVVLGDLGLHHVILLLMAEILETHQLRLVFCPHYSQGFGYIQTVVVWDFWTINSSMRISCEFECDNTQQCDHQKVIEECIGILEKTAPGKRNCDERYGQEAEQS